MFVFAVSHREQFARVNRVRRALCMRRALYTLIEAWADRVARLAAVLVAKASEELVVINMCVRSNTE